MSIIKKKVENIRHFTMISMILITKRNIKIITISMINMGPNSRKDLEERLFKMKRNMEMITINTENQALNIMKKEDTRKVIVIFQMFWIYKIVIYNFKRNNNLIISLKDVANALKFLLLINKESLKLSIPTLHSAINNLQHSPTYELVMHR